MVNNCHNRAFLHLKEDPTKLCAHLLENRLDMTMWNNRIETQVCQDSLALIADLKPTSEQCVNDPEDAECNPCTKFYDHFFDKYDVFVL